VATAWYQPREVMLGSEQHSSSGMADLEDRLTAQALADGDPAGWFERFYRAAAAEEVELPWDRAEPHRLLTRWAAERRLDGSGRRAVVVGCGQGADAEYVARLGFEVVAFDIAETAIGLARQRYPGSAVRYQAADLLNPPGEWLHAFDLVVEIITVQALPDPLRRQAITNVGRLAGQGGTLLVVEAALAEHECAPALGPWPLTRADLDGFGTDGLLPVGIELAAGPGGPADLHWLAEFRRPTRLTGINTAHRNPAHKPTGGRHEA
jgi:SAM-dependent methyltransferase